MTDRILEFLSHLLKIGKEQLFLKSGLLRNKVTIKPVLGLTGLGVLFMAVRPLLTSGGTEHQIDSSISPKDKPEDNARNGLHKTLHLMKEKEKELRQRETSRQNS